MSTVTGSGEAPHLRLIVGSSEQLFGGDQLPISLGGERCEVALPGVTAPEPLAYVSFADGDLFVQPQSDDVEVHCNGALLRSSRWLHTGDELVAGTARLRVESASGGEVVLRLETRARAAAAPAPETESATATPDRGPAPPAGAVTATISTVPFRPASLENAGRRRRRLHLGNVLPWALVVVLGAIAWAVFSSNPVLIEIEPAPDLFRLEGGLARPQLAGRYLLLAGDYQVHAAKAGYADLSETIQVDSSGEQTFSLSMQLLPTTVVFEVRDLEGNAIVDAPVAVDGVEIGTSPLAPTELERGSYAVRIDIDGYRPWEGSFEVPGGGTEQTETAELTPLWASLALLSTPSGASVVVDGSTIGRTPFRGRVLEGRRQLSLQLAGYQGWQRTLQVTAQQEIDLGLAQLRPLDAILSVASTPPEASLLVDGAFRGQTPVELALEPGRVHQLRLTLPGHDSVEREITLSSGQQQFWQAELPVLFGEIDLAISPADAELVIDGEVRETVQGILRLSAEAHEIEVRKDGYTSYRRTITPRPGFQQTIEVNLETEAEIRARARLAEITTHQGQKLVLVHPPGRFEMGASRRQPGRRANETLRTVELTRYFYIATEEVSNKEFRQFRESHLSGHAGGNNLEVDSHPVVRVTWNDAAQYCNWLSRNAGLPEFYVNTGSAWTASEPPNTGVRLPTEAEWAWAARYAGDHEPEKYGWGDSLPIPTGAGNFGDISALGLLPSVANDYDDDYTVTAPVDSFRANQIGLFHLAGNVAEWVHDYYTIYSSTQQDVASDPLGPTTGTHHVIRGASWMHSSVTELRLTYRDYGSEERPDVGFRVARYAE